MNEWGVVSVLITLAGFIAAVVGPIVKLNSTITRLSTIIDYVMKKLDELEKKDEKFLSDRKAAHEKIHHRIDEQGEILNDHENRISYLERKKENEH